MKDNWKEDLWKLVHEFVAAKYKYLTTDSSGVTAVSLELDLARTRLDAQLDLIEFERFKKHSAMSYDDAVNLVRRFNEAILGLGAEYHDDPDVENPDNMLAWLTYAKAHSALIEALTKV